MHGKCNTSKASLATCEVKFENYHLGKCTSALLKQKHTCMHYPLLQAKSEHKTFTLDHREFFGHSKVWPSF